ncbi:hypothetical protein E1258_01210 [Micromonospora sp. KC207]|uniref:hypothetical protein n=1 Tax=Micromonospora sp. KC207 TaxID=2530377 RepID=UPI001049B7A9|nr:hypothetical protein [Micromonospora sp. KC207]TDC67014.1 hypothetical protein E1258_01210 [Micromonospora sp. KC207]
MSGITGARYVVETAAERLAREQRAQWQQFVQVRGELEALRAEAEAYRSVYGSRISRVAAGARARPNHSPHRIAAATADVALLVGRERERLRTEVLAASRQDVSGLLDVPATKAADATRTRRQWDDSTVTEPARPASRQRDDSAAQAARARDDAAAQERHRARATRAAELLSRLPAATPDEVRAPCAAAVAEIAAGAPAGRAHLLLRDLEERVGAQQRAEERVALTRRDLLTIAAPLETVPGEAAARLRKRVARLVAERADRVPDGLRAEADEIVAQADRARRRKAVADAIRVGLTDLGYRVGEGFDTALAGTGVAYAAMDGDAGYGVKVLLDRDDPVIRTQVVRAGSTRAGRFDDVAAERKFCDDYEVIKRRVRRNGIPIDQFGQIDPGRQAVQVVADEMIPAQTHGAAGQQRKQGL